MFAILVVVVLGASLIGFGAGAPEFALLGLLSSVAFAVVSREASSA